MALDTSKYFIGVATALVTQNDDAEGLCRVKVRYPWHSDSGTSYWARLSVPMAGNDRGIVMIPEVGDEVLVAFERGDPRFPCVLGALWNAKQKPPLTNDDGKNDKRLVKSRKGHKLLLDDGAEGAVELSHVDGRRAVLDDRGVRIEDGKGNRLEIDSQNGAITIQASGRLTIKGSSVVLEASGTLDVKSSATLTLRGALVSIN